MYPSRGTINENLHANHVQDTKKTYRADVCIARRNSDHQTYIRTTLPPAVTKALPGRSRLVTASNEQHFSFDARVMQDMGLELKLLPSNGRPSNTESSWSYF